MEFLENFYKKNMSVFKATTTFLKEPAPEANTNPEIVATIIKKRPNIVAKDADFANVTTKEKINYYPFAKNSVIVTGISWMMCGEGAGGAAAGKKK